MQPSAPALAKEFPDGWKTTTFTLSSWSPSTAVQCCESRSLHTSVHSGAG